MLTQANVLKNWKSISIIKIVCLFAGLLQILETSRKLWCCLHAAEVAGSNPASPTYSNKGGIGTHPGPLCSNADRSAGSIAYG